MKISKDQNTITMPDGRVKRTSWNKGKKKPYADQDGYLWCDCDNPKLISGFHGRGQASCLLCGYPWFH
jgi:hypothetical protein